MPSTTIIGAGWAGLSCAYTLTKAGHQVTLIDAAPQTGGRARGIKFNGYIVDNGQHICLGAYHTLKKIIQELKLDINQLFNILPMELIAHGKHTLHMKFPNLPAPYHLLAGILTAKNIPWHIKYQTIKFCYQIQKINFKLNKDCSLLDFLKAYHQSEFIIEHLWEPIAVATMTTPIKIASAQVFLQVLQLAFAFGKEDSNWYLPATDLSSILPQHLEQYLQLHGSQIICSQSIKNLTIDNNHCTSISSNYKNWQADNFVLAIPPWQALPILAPHRELINEYNKLINFTYQSIITIYFEFAGPVNLDYPIMGLLHTTCQWVFDRKFAKQPNIISIVISCTDSNQTPDQTSLANQIFKELQAYFPSLPRLINQRVINEKRAAFTCSVEIQRHRPLAKSSVNNLWLTGDYLDTGLPATLEGALLSGQQTAKAILSNISPRSNQNC